MKERLVFFYQYAGKLTMRVLDAFLYIFIHNYMLYNILIKLEDSVNLTNFAKKDMITLAAIIIFAVLAYYYDPPKK